MKLKYDNDPLRKKMDKKDQYLYQGAHDLMVELEGKSRELFNWTKLRNMIFFRCGGSGLPYWRLDKSLRQSTIQTSPVDIRPIAWKVLSMQNNIKRLVLEKYMIERANLVHGECARLLEEAQELLNESFNANVIHLQAHENVNKIYPWLGTAEDLYEFYKNQQPSEEVLRDIRKDVHRSEPQKEKCPEFREPLEIGGTNPLFNVLVAFANFD